ncbi:MAG TPA: DegQ family serine endoprotease [Gammaproteobacteria bacterium]|nr:DegQ family serine endoprotease [Gammaproteobacteria bacterium]
MRASKSGRAGMFARHHRKFLASAAIVAAVAAATQLSAPPTTALAAVTPAQITVDRPESFAKLVKAVQPAVVNIATTARVETAVAPEFHFPEGSPFERYFRDFFGRGFPGQPQMGPVPKARALGSGFIIDPDGYVVTNNHVIDQAEEITVTVNGGDQYPAKIIGRDPKTDLALLKIEADEPFPYVQFGDSDAAQVGDWVIAVGNPFGLGGSVSAGIISARGRDIQSGPFDDYLQIDAPINRGNSGGPLFDRDGKVIGINTAIFSPSGGNVGIGFAIPSAMAETIVEQLKDSGRVERGFLGVQIQEVTEEIAQSLDLDEAKGALVASVEPNGPADQAGLKTGDLILAFDGQTVDRLKDLPRLVAAANAGEKSEVRILRDGNEQVVSVKVGRMPGDEMTAMKSSGSKRSDQARLGVALAPLTPEYKQRLRLPDDAEGVVIVDVERNSAAAREGLQAGDVIKRVGNKKVTTPEEVIEALESQANRKAVLLLVSRQGNDRFIAVPLDKA